MSVEVQLTNVAPPPKLATQQPIVGVGLLIPPIYLICIPGSFCHTEPPGHQLNFLAVFATQSCQVQLSIQFVTFHFLVVFATQSHQVVSLSYHFCFPIPEICMPSLSKLLPFYIAIVNALLTFHCVIYFSLHY